MVLVAIAIKLPCCRDIRLTMREREQHTVEKREAQQGKRERKTENHRIAVGIPSPVRESSLVNGERETQLGRQRETY